MTNPMYSHNTFACVNHHVSGETDKLKPAEAARGELKFRATSSSHPSDNPRYNGQDFRKASTKDPRSNVRSMRRTITGAVTITSFEAIPARQQRVTKTIHAARPVGDEVFQYRKLPKTTAR